MNLRFSAFTALAMAVSAVSFPAYAELVVDSAPVAKPSPGQASPGVITFNQPRSNTVIVRDASSHAVPSHASGSQPSGAMAWRPPSEFSSRSTSYVVQSSDQDTLLGQSIDRNHALGMPAARLATSRLASALPVPASRARATASGMSSEGRIIEMGGSGDSSLAQPLRGWANDIPLQMALSQVIPQDWSIQARGVDIGKPVSWRGNKPWIEILSDLTRTGRFNANVVWDRKLVVVFPVGAVDGTALAPIAPRPPVLVATSVQTVTPIMVAPVMMASSMTWKIDPALTLRGNIEAWTKQAGWNTVVWEAADYPMVAPAIFHGEFTSPEGPLAKLVDAYRDSDQPLEVNLSTMDKVVHVTNKNYQVPTVAPTTPQQIVPQVFSKP